MVTPMRDPSMTVLDTAVRRAIDLIRLGGT